MFLVALLVVGSAIYLIERFDATIEDGGLTIRDEHGDSYHMIRFEPASL